MNQGYSGMKRFGERIVKGQKYIRRPGAYVILPYGNQVLLTMQDGPDPEFQLPGGGIEAHEHVIPALHREVLEETGWIISKPRKFGIYSRFVYIPDYDLWAEKICSIYVARPCYQLCDPLEPAHSAHILSPDAAIEVTTDAGQNAFLRTFFGR